MTDLFLKSNKKSVENNTTTDINISEILSIKSKNNLKNNFSATSAINNSYYGGNNKNSVTSYVSATSDNNLSKINSKDINNLISMLTSESNNNTNTEKLENSYAGIMGKKIEPLIAPLGFDWKIGISLITSFAAREVFVGTMATIYSVGDADDTKSVREKMAAEINLETNKPLYSLAVALSLMLFYAFAMQCMSTMAVVYRETKSWKIPVIQFIYMGVLAYISSYIIYHLLR